MTNVPFNVLEIPQEFDVACVIRNMRPLYVLQTFIDHVSFYTSFSSVYTSGYKEVANTLGKYALDFHPDNVAHPFGNNNDFAKQCMKEIFTLAVKRGISEAKKRKKSAAIVKRLCRFMSSEFTTEKLYIDADTVLSVSDDLNLISAIHSISPKEYLQYFMSQVSLADFHARVGLRKPVDNPAVLFFEHLPFEYTQYQPLLPVITDEAIKMVDETFELHAEVFFIRDLDRRREIYREFFLNHYKKLKI